jgi:DNA replication protein DnaC
MFRKPEPGPDRLPFDRAFIIGDIVAVADQPGLYRRVTDEEKAQRRIESEARRQQQEIEQRKLTDLRSRQYKFEQSNIPSLHRFHDFESLEKPQGKNATKFAPAVAAMKAMLEAPAINCLVGPRGSGKTAIAACTCRYAASLDRTSYYTTAMGLFRSLREHWGAKNGNQGEQKFLHRLESVDLLVVDEIQERSESAWENSIITNLVDTRYAALRSTLLIGNLTAESVAASVGDSIASRMLDGGKILVADWPTWRRPGRERSEAVNKNNFGVEDHWPAVINDLLLVAEVDRKKTHWDGWVEL